MTGGKSTDGTERCPICDEPLNGETTITSEGKAHEECAGFDDGVDVLPDGGIELAGTDRESVWYCTGCEITRPTDEYSMKPCPDCGSYMVLRTVDRAVDTGSDRSKKEGESDR